LVEGVNLFLSRLGITSCDALLLAVSGGVDSMVLAEILRQLGYSIHVAHVNYHLRAEASNLDAALVKQWCSLHTIPFYCLDANPDEMGKESLQVWARNIRYAWFKELKEQYNCSFICTAHTLNDTIENFFMAMKRGAHVQSLAGIPERNQTIIRPLLKYRKSEIIAFAKSIELAWREDETNHESDYLRNQIRNEVLPLIQDFLPVEGANWDGTFTRLNRERNVLIQTLETFKKRACKSTKTGVSIDVSALLETIEPVWFLHEILKPLGFSEAICEQMARNLTQKHETMYITKSFSARLFDGQIAVNQHNEHERSSDEKHPLLIVEPIVFQATQYQEFMLQELALIKELDSEKLHLRKWRKGDYFYPSGMEGKKKLSDYYTDLKLTSEEKNSQWLLTYGEDIVWVVNRRIDGRFAAKKGERKALLLKVVLQGD